jgi:hypothetical protein
MLTALILVAPAILSPPAPAGAAPCFTHSEAKEHWPQAHLFWHTERHCYDRSRRGGDDYDVPISHDAKTKKNDVDQAVPGVHTTVYYPGLQVNAWPLPQLPLGGHDMSSWPVLLDVDAPTKFDVWRDRVRGSWSRQ